MNSTKLSLFCDRALEIGWLLAVIITPLFFNVYSSRVFEPDKLTTLRTIALVMAVLWIVKYIEERSSGGYKVEISWRTPLVLPTLLMVVVYLLSTALSVTPMVSLMGSYQRLQGTYTTLAYVVVFLVILQGMRTREQLERLITVVILNSLPISLYGLVQRNKLDPLPWGGDVTRRVASNMGNAIFVAAYLIMAVPPTLTRIIQAFQSILTDEEADATDIPRAATYIFILLVQLIAIFYTQSRGPLMGLLFGLGFWIFLGLLLLQQTAHRAQGEVSPRKDLWKDLGQGLLFGVASLVGAGLVAGILYFGGKAIWGESDLPQGLAAGGAVLTMVGTWMTFIVNQKGARWMWASAIVLAIFAGAGFFAVNPGGPLNEWAREQPSLRRITNVLDSSSGTGMVRNLIWQGALKLISPHDPIQYPPTDDYPEGHPDPYNSLRWLVGYGPESMYVAYNPFYPPLLGHFESRTASPDRSHNETMDSLVITGLLGFIVYVWIFGGIFYYGLRWLGFLPSDWRRIAFFALLTLGAIVSTAIVVPTFGPHFFCLAIPIGMVIGLFLYLLIYAFSVYWDTERAPTLHPYAIFLIGILSAVIAHFVEINFGIAIASTRTTFWAYAGAFVLTGLMLIRDQATETKPQETSKSKEKEGEQGRRRRRRRNTPPPPPQSQVPTWLWPLLTVAIIGGFVLGTLSFDFITNAERLTRPSQIVWRALTILATRNERTCTAQWDPILGECRSPGALMIFGLTWVMGTVVFVSEMAKQGAFRKRKGDLWLAVLLYAGVSLAVGLGFALNIAGAQAKLMQFQATTLDDVLSIAHRVAGFLTRYYWFIILVLLAGGAMLFTESLMTKARTRSQMQTSAQPAGLIALVVLSVLAGAIAVRTNLTPIQADIIYKQADPYDKGKQWLVAIEHYKQAIQLVPREDFYYLYLGRAYLEYASSLEDPTVRDSVMREAEKVLTQARELNPLNTDHSANLARMYRRWADFASDPETKTELLRKSSLNYEWATTLSPQNAILWNEWSMLYLYGLGDQAGYERTHQRSMELDADFDQTWLICGDANRQLGELEAAVHCYTEALRVKPRAAQVWRVLGDTYIALQQWDDAIHALTKTVELQPRARDLWNIHQVLAQLYAQVGDIEQAVFHAQTALELAPEDQRASLQDLLAQLQAIEAGAGTETQSP